VERWHQTLQTDFLDDAGPFATIAAAQATVDAWRQEYNTARPHQGPVVNGTGRPVRAGAGRNDVPHLNALSVGRAGARSGRPAQAVGLSPAR
jgi:hypothetical protein